jgi:hypothetical protein
VVSVEPVSYLVSLLSLFLAVLAARPVATVADSVDIESGLAFEIVGLHFSIHCLYIQKKY